MYICGNVVSLSIFSKGKIFNGIPEYVVVKNEEKNIACLYRLLMSNERFNQFDQISFIITDNDIKEGRTKGNPCIFLTTVESIEAAEKIVNSYHACTDTLGKKREVMHG